MSSTTSPRNCERSGSVSGHSSPNRARASGTGGGQNMRLVWDAFRRHGHASLAYLLLWVLLILALLYRTQNLGEAAMTSDELVRSLDGTGYVLAFLCGGLAVMSNFRFLFGRESAGFYASLPLSRQRLYLITLLAALVPLFVAVAVIALLLLGPWASLGLGASDVASWAGTQVLMLLVFCGMATLGVQVAGRPGVAFIAYLMENFYGAVMEWGLSVFAMLIAPTIAYPSTSIWWISPTYALGLEITTQDAGGFATGGPFWQKLVVCGLIGVACMAVSGILFCHRDFERGGDAFVFNPAHAVFSVLFSVGCGLGLTLLLSTIFYDGSLGALIAQGGVPSPTIEIVLVLSCGVAVLLTEAVAGRSIRAIRQHLPNVIAVVATGLVLAVACSVGILGAERSVPDVSQVAQVGKGQLVSMPLQSEAAIQSTTKLHRQLVDDYESRRGESTAGDSYQTAVISYQMKDGSTLARTYAIRTDLDGTNAGGAGLSASARAIEEFFDDEAVKNEVKGTLEDALQTNAQRALVTIGNDSGAEDTSSGGTSGNGTTQMETKVFPSVYPDLLSALEADVDERGIRCVSTYAETSLLYGSEDAAWVASVTVWSGFSSDANKAAAPVTIYLSKTDTPHTYEWAKSTYGTTIIAG